jgi:hypothetical protein
MLAEGNHERRRALADEVARPGRERVGVGWAALAAAWSALALLLAARLGDGALDDLFITYRYADNLARGRGFVFNPGERVFGTTAPGFGLLLAAAHGLTAIPIPRLGTLSTAAALVAIACLLAREGRARGRAAEAALGGTLAVGCTWIWGCRGAEAPVALALVLGAAALAGRRPAAAGALAGAAIWIRPDAALAAGLLAIILWLDGLGQRAAERWRILRRYAIAAGGVVAAGLAAAWAAFGTFVPNTWLAKRVASGSIGLVATGFRGWWAPAVPLLARHLGARWELLLALGLCGQILLLRVDGRAGRLLAAYGLALALVYPLLGAPFAGWYAIPTVLAALYGVAWLLVGLGRLAGSPPRPPALRAAAAAAALVLAVLVLPPLVAAQRAWLVASAAPALHYAGYQRAGLYLHAAARPDERIAALEVGTLAYWSDRPVDDLLGLVTPSSLPFVARGDLAGAFFARPREFLVLRPELEGFLGGLLRSRRFRRRYAEVLRLDGETDDWTAIYRRRPAAAPAR